MAKTRQTPPKVRELFDDAPICTYLILCGELAKRNLLLRDVFKRHGKARVPTVILEPSRAIRIMRQIHNRYVPNAKQSDLMTLSAYGLITLKPFLIELTAIGRILIRNTSGMDHTRLVAGSHLTDERNHV